MRSGMVRLGVLVPVILISTACGKVSFEPAPLEPATSTPVHGADTPLPNQTPLENHPDLPSLPTQPPETVDLKPDDIFIEAESGVLSGPQKMLVQASTGASSGKFLASSPLLPLVEDAHIQGPIAEEMATYSFRVQREKEFVISARVFAPRSSQDSFWIQIDELPAMQYHTAECIWPWADRWVWTDVKTLIPGNWITVNGISCLPTQKKTFRLSGGEHTLRLRKRESLSLIDAFLIKALN